MTDYDQDVYDDVEYDYSGGRVLWGRFAFWGVALLLMFVLGRACAPQAVSESDLASLNRQIVDLTEENTQLRNQLDAEDAGGTNDDAGEAEDAEDEAEEGDGEATGAADAPEGSDTYTVQQGDTLRGIAQRVYGDPDQASRIVDANGLDRDAPLRVDQQLIIPPAG